MSLQEPLTKSTAYNILENVLMMGLGGTCIMKNYIILHKYREDILKVIQKLNQHFPHLSFEQRKYGTYKYFMTFNVLTKLFFYSTMALTTQYCLMPYLYQAYGALFSIDVEWTPVFVIKLFFDQTESGVYECIYIFEVWLSLIATFAYLTGDIMITTMTQLLVMEFDILGHEMSEIDVKNGEEETIKNMKALIDVHQELIEVAEKINQIFSPLLLIDVIAWIITLCTAAFLFVVSDFFPDFLNSFYNIFLFYGFSFI